VFHPRFDRCVGNHGMRSRAEGDSRSAANKVRQD
jgi:hypothetical protein